MQYQQTLRVLVGPALVEYIVPQVLLVEKSDFFRAACSKGWKKAEERLVRLPEMNPTVFDDYLHWLYRGRTAVREREGVSDRDFAILMWTCLVDLWIAADQLGDTGLRCGYRLHACSETRAQTQPRLRGGQQDLDPDCACFYSTSSLDGLLHHTGEEGIRQ